MAEETTIEWTTDPVTGRPGSTWSPVTGCTDADESCKWCYAKKLTASRLKTQPKYQGLAKMGKSGPQWTGEVRIHPNLLKQPLGWKGRRRIFVCSMSDLFHKDVPFDFIAQVWAAMAISYQHRGHLHLCLTKRTRRARLMLRGGLSGENGEHFNAAVNRHFRALVEKHGYSPWFADADVEWPVPGIHLGMSAGRQKEAVERWRDLSHTPVQARFMSIEPMIGPVDLQKCVADPAASGLLPDQVIGGGESGTRQRCRVPHPSWGSDLMADCESLGVPGFWKQWGNWRPGSCGDHRRELVVLRDGSTYTHAQIAASAIEDHHRGSTGGWAPRLDPSIMSYGTKKNAGREIDGATFDGYPSVCSSCYRPLESDSPKYRCGICDSVVCCVFCMVDDSNRPHVGTFAEPGTCRGCLKDGRKALARLSSATENPFATD